MKAAVKKQEKRRIAFVIRHTEGLKAVEELAELRRLPFGSLVLIYRTKTRKWEGPHVLVSIDAEASIVQKQVEGGIYIYQILYAHVLNPSLPQS